MNKKGYTLIELLATLTILAMIMVIVFPSLSALLVENDKRLADNVGNIMIAAARKDINDEKRRGSGCIIYTLGELKSKGLIDNIDLNGKIICSDSSFVRADISSSEKSYNYVLSCSKDGGTTYEDYYSGDTSVSSSNCNFESNSKSLKFANKGFSQPNIDKINSELSKGTSWKAIPIKYDYDNNVWIMADERNLKKDPNYWYDYSLKEWANMGIIEREYEVNPGDTIDMDRLVSMWVWIPRFFYNVDASGNVDIVFKKKDVKSLDGYKLSDAFVKYSDSEEHIDGFWIAKFDSKILYNDIKCPSSATTISNQKIYIKGTPNLVEAGCYGVIDAFVKAKDIEKEYFGDVNSDILHMTRASEFAAVRLLSASKYGTSKGKGNIVYEKWSIEKNYAENSANSSTLDVYGVYNMYYSGEKYMYTDLFVGNYYNVFYLNDTIMDKSEDYYYAGNLNPDGYNYKDLINKYFQSAVDFSDNKLVFNSKEINSSFSTSNNYEKFQKMQYVTSEECGDSSEGIIDTYYEGIRAITIGNSYSFNFKTLYYNFCTEDTKYNSRAIKNEDVSDSCKEYLNNYNERDSLTAGKDKTVFRISAYFN